MKIFAVSDIHGRYKDLRKVIDYANSRTDISTVLFCGDISSDYEFSSLFELSKLQEEDYLCFTTMIEEIKNRKTYYILGNHDVFKIPKDDNNYLPNAYINRIEKTFIPFELVTMKFYGTNREVSEVEIKSAFKDIKDIDNTKILVAHQPPHGCLDSILRGVYYGSTSIRKMINDKVS